MANQHSNKPILIARGGKLLPIYMEPPIAVGGPDITVGGCAPTTYFDAATGITKWYYQPSAQHSINVLGEAPVTVKLGGVTTYCYPATGGITMGGSTDVDASVTRGGRAKGIRPRPRVRTPQRTVHYYQAEAFFENTLQLGGEATYSFVPAPKFDIFKELEVEYEKHPTPQAPKTYSYTAEGGIKAGGQADEDFFDFRNFIIMHDEDIIIADILSADGNPFITTTFSQNYAKQRRDDDDIMEILELL